MSFNAGDIEASLTLDRSPFNQGLRLARIDADKFEKQKITATIEVDRDRLDAALRGGTTTSKQRVRVPVEVDQNQLMRQLERIGDNTETTARRSGNRLARALLNPVVIQLGLLPGIAAAAAAGAGLALGGLTAAFGVVGALALKNNQDVTRYYKDMWTDVKKDTQEAAKVLEPYAVEIAREFRMAFSTIRPELRGIFQAIGPQVLDLSQGITGLATNAMPGFERSVRQSGPAIRGLESLLKSTGTGVGEFFDELGKGSLDTKHGLELLGQLIQSFLSNVGRLATTFSSGWSDIGPQFVRTIDLLLAAINNFVSGGMGTFTDTLKVTLGVLEQVLKIVTPIADILGSSVGSILGVAAAWKLLAGSVGLVTKTWGAVNPAAWTQKMAPATNAIDRMAQSTGGLITRVSGMPMAGAQFTNVMKGIGGAVVGVARNLPLIGFGVAAAKGAIDHFFPSADDLSAKMARGGKDAEEASKKVYDLAGGYSRTNFFAAMFGTRVDELQAALKRQRESMTGVERAQMDLVKAQNDYQFALDKFGAGSPQAIRAQEHLAAATIGVEDAQLRAAKATQTHIDKIIFQTNLLLGSVGARLNYEQSLLTLEQNQKNAAEATAKHGAKSLEARQANNQYQQSLLGVVTSIGERAKAENAGLSDTEQSRIATFAMHQEIARLAVIAGKDAPPALLQLAGGLSDSELAAMGVTREVDKTGKTIYKLPPGKTLSFPNDAPIAQAQVENLHRAVDNLPKRKNFDYVINVVTGQEPGIGGLLGPNNFRPPGRAEGGPVRRNMAYWVGEQGLPELFFPNVDGFILNGRDSARVRTGETGAMANTALLGGNQAEPNPEQWLPLLVTALAQALDGIRLRVDGSEWARLVNGVNLANARRG